MAPFLQSKILKNTVHAFTDKRLGDDYPRIAQELGVASSSIVTLNQIHSNKVFVVTSEFIPQAKNNRLPLDGDALITNEPGVLVGIRTADCLPLLVYDPVKKVVAAIHAGWKGLVAGVIENTLNVMKGKFGSSPGDLLVTLGIAICEKCFEVGPEVVEAFQNKFGERTLVKKGRDDRSHISLRGMAIIELPNLGINKDNLELISGCTSCHNEHIYSYRKGDKEGRNLSVIGI